MLAHKIHIELWISHYLINYLLALFLISAAIYNLLFSRKNRVEVEGYMRVNERFEEQCAASCDCACARSRLACYETLESCGFDRLCSLRRAGAQETMQETIFVFINKNYAIYLEIYCSDGVIKNIELMSQFYDSRIHITTTDAEKKLIGSRWIVVEAAPVRSESDFLDGGAKDIIESLVEKHTAKLFAAHSGPLAPYYATPSGYASCKNYVNDILKLDRMAAG